MPLGRDVETGEHFSVMGLQRIGAQEREVGYQWSNLQHVLAEA